MWVAKESRNTRNIAHVMQWGGKDREEPIDEGSENW